MMETKEEAENCCMDEEVVVASIAKRLSTIHEVESRSSIGACSSSSPSSSVTTQRSPAGSQPNEASFHAPDGSAAAVNARNVVSRDLVEDDVSSKRSSSTGKGFQVNGVQYEQIRVLGRGGSSKVYLVRCPDGQQLALKRVRAETSKQLEAFENEVTLLQQLRHCKRVIQVFNAEIERDRLRISIVMEAGDMDFARFLRSSQGLSIDRIRDLWRQMLEAVQVIHNNRIVHSDLKPSNFLLVGRQLKVIDFGIAKKIANDTTNISRDSSVGTIGYMAPEAVCQGRLKLSRASDVWSLGIILYQMVDGRVPFEGLEPWQRALRLGDPALTIEPPAATEHLGDCSEASRLQLLDVLDKCLQREPRCRPSLPELLNHPFLRTKIEVNREMLESSLCELMVCVTDAVAAAVHGDGLRPDAVSPAPTLAVEDPACWQPLVDAFWQRLVDHAEAEPKLASGAQPPLQLVDGVVPLKEMLCVWADGPHRARTAATISADTSRGSALIGCRQPLQSALASTNTANMARGTSEGLGCKPPLPQPRSDFLCMQENLLHGR